MKHVLAGIRPEPLASYLAGLGLVRMLGEQTDAELTAWWEDTGLVLETTVDDVATWLTERYVPTPVLRVWNENSSFSVREGITTDLLNTLLSTASPRLDPYRDAMEAARDVGRIAHESTAWSPEQAVREFRNRCPEAVLPWIDAAAVIAGDQLYFPPLLGTGGNDGRFDFSTNLHQHVVDLLGPQASAARSLELARDLLAGTQVERLTKAAVGQFDPAAAGGPNSSPFGAAESMVNPWAYVLLIEGALMFAATVVRRNQHAAGRAAVPFTVSPSPAGSSSGAISETSRGELWTPLWSVPFTLAEIRQLFGEARASWRGRPAQQAVDFYAATRTLGVARGIQAFTRYGLHERNGQAHIAVPIERVTVTNHPEVALAAQLEDWVSRVRRSEASRAVEQQLRRFDAAYIKFARDGGPFTLCDLLAALTDLEQAVGRSGRAREAVPARRPPKARDFLPWLRKIDSPEFRVAVGIASCTTVAGAVPARSMREILLPIDPGVPRPEWRDTPVVSGFGARRLRDVLADVLAWRARTASVIEPPPRAGRILGVRTFRRGVPVPAADLHAFATRGSLDEELVSLWLRACLALDWDGAHVTWSDVERPTRPVPLLGLLHPFANGLPLDGSADDPVSLGLEPDWPNRLVAGQTHRMYEEAALRLRRAGWRVMAAPVRGREGELGGQVAAALLPRCRDANGVLKAHLAIRVVTPDAPSIESEEDEYEEEIS